MSKKETNETIQPFEGTTEGIGEGVETSGEETLPPVETNPDENGGDSQPDRELTDEEKEAEKAAVFTSQPPNIKFIARVRNPKFIDKETTPDDEEFLHRTAPAKLTAGNVVFDLPDAETQAKGFYHPDAAVIIRTFPRLYKRLTDKGEN